MLEFLKKGVETHIKAIPVNHGWLEVCSSLFMYRDTDLCLYFLVFLFCCGWHISGLQPLGSCSLSLSQWAEQCTSKVKPLQKRCTHPRESYKNSKHSSKKNLIMMRPAARRKSSLKNDSESGVDFTCWWAVERMRMTTQNLPVLLNR